MRPLGIILGFLLSMAGSSIAAEKLSPFTKVEIKGGVANVIFERRAYELRKIDGLDAGKVLAYCKQRYGRKAEKRFAEDLVEVLEGMKRKVGQTISLVLFDPATKKLRNVKSAPMSRANRQAVYRARNAPRAAVREPKSLNRAAVLADIDELRERLLGHHSYRFLRPRAIDALVWDRLPESLDVDLLALHMARAVAILGDGHTRVRGIARYLPPGYAPFVARVCGDGVIALNPKTDHFFVRNKPYLVAIHGVPIAKWLGATHAFVARGSTAWNRWRGAEALTFLSALSAELGLKPSKTAKLSFAATPDGTATMVQRSYAVKPHRIRLARRNTRLLRSGVGYLRIATMDSDPAVLGKISASLAQFQSAKGLIIDVRDNGGGTRDILRLLLPAFLKEPRVVNAAVYRLPDNERPENKQGHLADRFLFPKSWRGWTDNQRGVISEFIKDFRPEWEPPHEHFSMWHYMVIEDAPRDARFTKPTIILMDGGCFSATDIFLAAFQGAPNVRLLGTTSGGGSGRSQSITLTNSRIRLKISSMASFQPNGKLYDGNGVQPDVVVEKKPSDWTGETDTQLEAAIARLTK